MKFGIGNGGGFGMPLKLQPCWFFTITSSLVSAQLGQYNIQWFIFVLNKVTSSIANNTKTSLLLFLEFIGFFNKIR